LTVRSKVAGFQRGIKGGNKEYRIQAKNLRYFLDAPQMTEMDRIERPAEDPDLYFVRQWMPPAWNYSCSCFSKKAENGQEKKRGKKRHHFSIIFITLDGNRTVRSTD